MERRLLSKQINQLKNEVARMEAWEKQNPLPATIHFIEGADFVAQIATVLAAELRAGCDQHDWQLRDLAGDVQHCVRCGQVRPSWTLVTA